MTKLANILKTTLLSAILIGVTLTSINLQANPTSIYAGADGIPGATTASQIKPFTASGTPLTLDKTFSLPGKMVLIYTGVETQLAGFQSINMAGFTAPTSNIAAKTTWIVGDGQTGSPTGNPGGFLSNFINFTGGTMVQFGPPAITGADGTANGNYLWDTETHDVSSSFVSGATTASASMTSNGDCLTWQAQVLDIGSAGSIGGYAANGIGLRDRDNGTISISGIPAGNVPVAAFLYWGILNDTQPTSAIMVNGNPVTGTLVGSDVSPCWPPSTYWGFKADVTSLVTGNGNYVISGYPTGETDNADPWGVSTPNTPPDAEGASLVIVYAPKIVTQGNMTGGGSIIDPTIGRVTHGFELQCDVTKTPNSLQVNWGQGNKFHLTSLTSVFCLDDTSISPNPPAAGFDTYIGTGNGTYNGVPGATAKWTFTDAGEPGTNDHAKITITDSGGNVVLAVSGNLHNGNQQAHNQ